MKDVREINNRAGKVSELLNGLMDYLDTPLKLTQEEKKCAQDLFKRVVG